MDYKILNKMKKITIILFVTIISISCKKYSVNVEDSTNNGYNIVKILNDSINFFNDVKEFSIDKNQMENDSIKIIYYSITKSEFFNAMYKNEKNIQFFNSDYKLNEDIRFRKENQITLTNTIDTIRFIDLPSTNINRPSYYFLQGIIGDFYIIKKIHFEDADTYLYNSKSLNLGKELSGITSSFESNKSLLFYIYNPFFSLKDSSQLSFLKTNKNQVKYLLNVEVDWFTSFSFFDDENNLYYIHSFYDENFEIKSTYAKMEYYLKK